MSLNSIFPLFLTKKGPTVKAVQEVLQRIGEASAGTKDVVQNRLLTKVMSRKILQPAPPRGSAKGKTSRILSIDMGIKNLAYCVADVKKPAFPRATTSMDFLTWRRLDLGEAFREYGMNSSGGAVASLENEKEPEAQGDEDLYTPENLSRMGYWFLNKVLDEWNPDVILVERQRWRSAGSPTIQQWTVRVNTLEAVMWTVITALKAERKKSFDWQMYAVDPKRVGHFWLDGVALPSPARTSKMKTPKSNPGSEDDEDMTAALADENGVSTKKLTRSKAEKRAKIHLLRTWLDAKHPSTAPSLNKTTNDEDPHPNISFTFSKTLRSDSSSLAADATRQALLYATDTPSERAKRTQSMKYTEAYVKKVDDITDCFLQAAAWVAWDENLRRLQPEVDALRTQVKETLGREWDGRLVDGVREVQVGLGVAEGADEVESKVKKTPKARKATEETKKKKVVRKTSKAGRKKTSKAG